MRQKEVIPAGGGWVDRSARDFEGSPFERIGGDWMLITAGDVTADKGNWNTMTASWGGLGVLWGKDIAIMFIRPSRRTFEFAKASLLFTLSFFDASFRQALDLCGSKSGRDIDKAKEAGLSPIVFDGGTPAGGQIAGSIGFAEAAEIIICKKLYTHDFDPSAFLDSAAIEKNYKGTDYHRMFIGEILTIKARG